MLKKPDHDEVWKLRYENDPDVTTLIQSSQYAEILRLLAMRQSSNFSKEPIEHTVASLVQRGLKGPDLSEKMTGSERRKLAASIVTAATTLRDSLKLLLVRESFPFEFQATFDDFACGVAMDRFETVGAWDEEEFDEDAYDHSRYGAYHLLMECFPETLAMVAQSAKWWAESERILKKPNDPNAKRLFFIRTVTQGLYYEFKTPMRAATMALTSIFFNCDDIDEAALSRLAPPPKPYEMSAEGLLMQADQLEQFLNSSKDGDAKARSEMMETIANNRAKAELKLQNKKTNTGE